MRRSLAGVAAGAAAALLPVLYVCLGATGASAAPAVATTEPGIESDFVAGINAVRADAGLHPLQVHGELTSVARSWSATMAAENAIWHNPNVGSQVSAPWVLIGENVGAGYDVSVLMQAFVDSPSHYRNLVEPDYDFVGVGVTYGSDGRMYTAHVFMDLDGGVPAPAPAPAPAPEPAPEPEQAPAVAPAPAPAPAPALVVPPAAAAPERVERVLAAVFTLDTGVV